MSRNPYGQKNAGGACACSDCGLMFTGLTGFDAHFSREHPDGSRHGKDCGCSDWWPRCLTVAELRVKGYAPNARGRWGDASQDARWVPVGRTETADGAGAGP